MTAARPHTGAWNGGPQVRPTKNAAAEDLPGGRLGPFSGARQGLWRQSLTALRLQHGLTVTDRRDCNFTFCRKAGHQLDRVSLRHRIETRGQIIVEMHIC
ncbi:hypothetical protein GCM10011452_34660 [Gemmobacter lanyuensis]|uniref:Uncharacterized protein n=1 Tax=Gemmobacter lanyuensis TaxID=1054497 RepID=A0A918MQ48_9RHOB|nr:hypothetical protein GCM10011452_34660 [Gemmobacter lanyuensis]